MQRLSGDERERAAQLAERWREAAAGDISGLEGDGEVYVSVAEVAAACDVTPQAVYKWMHKGVIEAHTRPGGSYRIPIAASAAGPGAGFRRGDARADPPPEDRIPVEIVTFDATILAPVTAGAVGRWLSAPWRDTVAL